MTVHYGTTVYECQPSDKKNEGLHKVQAILATLLCNRVDWGYTAMLHTINGPHTYIKLYFEIVTLDTNFHHVLNTDLCNANCSY